MMFCNSMPCSQLSVSCRVSRWPSNGIRLKAHVLFFAPNNQVSFSIPAYLWPKWASLHLDHLTILEASVLLGWVPLSGISPALLRDYQLPLVPWFRDLFWGVKFIKIKWGGGVWGDVVRFSLDFHYDSFAQPDCIHLQVHRYARYT